ncbi:MAG: hypothetical protein MZV64_71140 [Ignavibacteriales bacterium]|nr:hypothetical protein [Ignavibacteriales bacterium]
MPILMASPVLPVISAPVARQCRSDARSSSSTPSRKEILCRSLSFRSPRELTRRRVRPSGRPSMTRSSSIMRRVISLRARIRSVGCRYVMVRERFVRG